MEKLARTNEIEWKSWQLLTDHGITTYPIDPVLLANAVGIQVYNTVFREAQISGAITKRDGATKIYVSENEAPSRKRFTVAHELGHYVLHMSADDNEMIDTEAVMFRTADYEPGDAQGVREAEANRFAASLLMPHDLVVPEYRRTRSLARLAQMFSVSEDAMYNRLKSLRLVY